MSVVSTSTPNGFSIFCDDVRVEGNGKQIYIGVYLGEMLLTTPTASFPIRLPSLHVIVNYRERKGDSDKPVRLCILIPGQDEPLVQTEIPREHLDSIPLPTGSDIDDPMVLVSFIFAMRDVVLTQEGRIKVRAYLGDDEVRLGSLKVSLVPPPSTVAAPDAPPVN